MKIEYSCQYCKLCRSTISKPSPSHPLFVSLSTKYKVDRPFQVVNVKIGASICRNTKIQNCLYVKLPNLKESNLEIARNRLERIQDIGTIFLFLAGNQLFPSHNFVDREGNAHTHRVQRKRFKNKQVELEMEKYKAILRICSTKNVHKIVVVPCYLRNVYRSCAATYDYCTAQNLREAFSLTYSKRIINLAIRKMAKLIAAENLSYKTISLKRFEYICLNEQVKKLSKRELILKILGEDEVHLSPDSQRLLEQHLSNYARRGSPTARSVGECQA